MDPWIYVERVNIEVEGIDPQTPNLLQIRIDLNRVPEGEWQALFEDSAADTGSTSMRPPRLVSDAIMIGSPDEEIEDRVRQLDRRITTTNEQYASRVLPRLQAERAERAKQADEQQRRLHNAQRRLDDL